MPPKKKGKKEDAEEQKKKEEEEANKAAAAAAAEEEAALQAAEEAAMRKMEDLTARWIPIYLSYIYLLIYLSNSTVISTIIQHCCQPGPHELHHGCVFQTQRRSAEDDRPHPRGPALDTVHEGENIFSVLLKYF